LELAMALTVLIKQEGEDDLTLTLDAPRIVIGRSRSCEIQLVDPSVSSRHASIRLQGGRNLVIDEGSTNGIAVGPVKLPAQTPRAIADGDLIRIGRVWLEVRFGAGVSSTPAEVRAVAMDHLAAQLRAQGEPLAPSLEVIAGPDTGRQIELSDAAQQYVVGRGADSDLKLTDARCSRRHVAVERVGDGWTVRDLGSKIGAELASDTLTRNGARWSEGAELTIGDTTMVLRDPLRRAWEETLDAEDVKMRAEEWAQGPPGTAPEEEPAPMVEAPTEAAPEPVLPEPRSFEPLALASAAAIEPRGIAYATVDLFVAMVAIGLIGISIAGLMYVLG
jgi:pSer/pThr/pTyr-binding forkhead associated (FHA) protein